MSKKTISTEIIEKVHNIQGSTAGAGSGEYQRYRLIKQKEQTRQINIEKQEENEKIKKNQEKRKKLINNFLLTKQEKARNKRLKRKNKQLMKIKMKDEEDEIPLILKIKPETINDSKSNIEAQIIQNIEEYYSKSDHLSIEHKSSTNYNQSQLNDLDEFY